MSIPLAPAPIPPASAAREGIYRFLAGALSDPRQPDLEVHDDGSLLDWLQAAAELLRADACEVKAPLGFGEQPAERLRFGLLWSFRQDLSPTERQLEHERVFGLMSCRECPPFETEFFPNSEPFFRSQQMADIAGFYQAFGLRTPANRSLRPDLLPLELEFMAFLMMKERLAETPTAAEICRQAARGFFAEHLAWWVPSFTRGLRAKAGEGYYAELAKVLSAFIALERQRFGLPAPASPLEPRADLANEDEACASCSARPA